MKKKVFIGLLAVVLMAAGCNNTTDTKLKDGEQVVASIEGTEIAANEIYEKMKAKYAKDVLTEMVDKIILDKLYPTNDDITATVDTQISSIKAQFSDNFEDTLKAYGYENEQALFDEYLVLAKRNLYILDYTKELLTDKEVSDYYDENYDISIEASHILIIPDSTDTMSAEEKEAADLAARTLATEIIAKLDAGEDFAVLAKEYSKDSSAENGGALGEFNKGDMVEEFETAAYALKVNEYTKEVVRTQYGYHIILKTAENEKPTLESVKEDILEELANTKLSTENAIQYEAMFELRKDNKFTINDTIIKNHYDAFVKDSLAE